MAIKDMAKRTISALAKKAPRMEAPPDPLVATSKCREQITRLIFNLHGIIARQTATAARQTARIKELEGRTADQAEYITKQERTIARLLGSWEDIAPPQQDLTRRET